MNILKTIKKWFSEKPKIIVIQEISKPENKKVIYNGIEKFWCHYCGKTFEIEPEKITTKEVQLLYTERWITGKAYVCPYCNEINIIG